MKIYFLPFKLALIKFDEGKLKIQFNRFRNIKIWCLIVGKFMLVNNRERLQEVMDWLRKNNKL